MNIITFKKISERNDTQMRIKVKLRPMVGLFNIQNEPIRNIFKGTLSEDLLKGLEEKYPTLGEYQEAEKKDIVELTSAKLYEAMKESISEFIEELIIYATYVTSAELVPLPMRVAYGKLAADANLYFMSIFMMQERIQRMPENERKFIEAYYGLSGKGSATEAEIAEKFGITADNVSQYKEKLFSNF